MKALCTALLLLSAITCSGLPALSLSEAEMDYATACNLVRQKHYSKSIPFFDHAIKLAPEQSNFYSDRGAALLALEEYRRALSDFNVALKLNPDNGKCYEHRARCQAELGNLKAAVIDVSDAIKRERDQHHKGTLLKLRSSFYIDLGQTDKALADLTASISVKPNEYYNYSARANMYISLHQYEKAVADYTQAIKLNDGRFDDFDSLYGLRATAYEKMGRKDLAAQDRKKAKIYADGIKPM